MSLLLDRILLENFVSIIIMQFMAVIKLHVLEVQSEVIKFYDMTICGNILLESDDGKLLRTRRYLFVSCKYLEPFVRRCLCIGMGFKTTDGTDPSISNSFLPWHMLYFDVSTFENFIVYTPVQYSLKSCSFFLDNRKRKLAY